MPELLVEGDEIVFETPGWSWAGGFNGVLKPKPGSRAVMRIGGKQVLVEADLLRLADSLLGKEYTTPMFQTPGRILSATIVIDIKTLAQPCRLHGNQAVVRTTQGTFQIKCVSAMNTDLPAADPVTTKSGTWSIRSNHQWQARSVLRQGSGIGLGARGDPIRSIAQGIFQDSAISAELDREKLRKQLIRHENIFCNVYPDSKGILTIGVGFNLTRKDAKGKIEALGLNYKKILAGEQELSVPQIDLLLDADIATAIADCKSVFPNFTELSDVRQRVLIDMMFNLGKPKFLGFEKMIGWVKVGNFDKAADEMKDSAWYHQVRDRGPELEAMMRTNTDTR